MPESWIDPESLEGDALTQWYLRSPVDVERERQEAAARRYEDFFYRRLREGQRPLKPDMGTPKRNPIDPDKRKYIELKPDSPSGTAAGARALQRYRNVTNDFVRLLFYTLKDFI